MTTTTTTAPASAPATDARADLLRVCVVGTSGAGKTTFGRALAAILGSPFVELDALHWGPNWTVRPDFAQQVLAAASEPRWVMDGNYSGVRELSWRSATSIVWLNYSFARVLSRALVRTATRLVTRERLYAGNQESLRSALFNLEGIPWWVVRTYHRRRRQLPALFAAQPKLKLLEFRTPSEAEGFLRALAAAKRPM